MEKRKWFLSERLMKNTKVVAVAVFVLSLFAVFNPSLQARQTEKGTRSVWDAVYTREQGKRGETQYAQYCSSCHGPDLLGNDEAAPLTGSAFLANWEGLSVGDLTERIRVSMPPNSPGKLSRQQIVDMISYMLSFNSFPAGKTELDPRAEVLKQIKIEGTKPKAE